MFSRILLRFSLLIVSAFSLNQAYSIFALPLDMPCSGHVDTVHYQQVPYDTFPDCKNFVKARLDSVYAAGFTTIDFMYSGAEGPSTNQGALTGTKWRAAYKTFLAQVLNDGRFNVSVRVNTSAPYLSGTDAARRIQWDSTQVNYNRQYFLQHAPINPPTIPFDTATPAPPSVGPWDPTVDFYTISEGKAVRQRTLNAWNPYVRGLILDYWRVVVNDVMQVADSLGVPQKILWFGMSWNSTGETEYQHDFFSGDVNGSFSPAIYGDPLDDANRIDWVQARQDSLATFHGQLSGIIKHLRDSLSLHFQYGAQMSGLSIGTSLMRGHIDLARIASHLNTGDWIFVADIADTFRQAFNHNFSMDYARSIASTYGLHISNEVSPPKFWAPQYTIGETNVAYHQQAARSFNHGAAAFFITNWASSDQFPSFYDYAFNGGGDANHYLIPFVAQNFAGAEAIVQQRGKNAIFLDPWALYATESRSDTNIYGNPTYATQNLYSNGVFKEIYDSLSHNGSDRVDILTPTMLADHPEVLDEYRKVYFPALDSILSINAKNLLASGSNKHKLTLFGNRIGIKDAYQNASMPMVQMLADDLLWTDWTDKNSFGYPTLQVALSTGTPTISVAQHWTQDGQFSNVQGIYVGDFNGDGLDDVLDYAFGLDMYLSNGAGFDAPQSWFSYFTGSPSDLFAGDFTGDGKSDLLWADKDGNWDSGLWLFRSNGTTFDTVYQIKSWNGLDSSLGFYVGDFNGDDTADFLNFTRDHKLMVSLSGTHSPVEWGDWGADPEDIRVGDFNGDGRDDLLWIDRNNKYPSDMHPAFEYAGIQVALSTGTRIASATFWKPLSSFSSSQRFYVGDFNGDGRTDLMNLTTGQALEIALASNRIGVNTGAWINDTTNFGQVQSWGTWGADTADLYVGNFGRPGGGLPKRGVGRPAALLARKDIQMRGDLLFFRGLSGPVSIYNISGKKLLQTTVRENGNLNVSSLPSGVYYLRMTDYRTRFVR